MTKSKVPDFPVKARSAQQIVHDGLVVPDVRSNRLELLALVLGAAVICLALALAFLAPLKTVRGVVLMADAQDRLRATGQVLGEFKPNQQQIKGAINAWAQDLLKIESRSDLDKAQERVGAQVVETAVGQLREYRERNNPWKLLKDNPAFRREYVFRSINFTSKDAVLLRFSTVTWARGSSEETFILTANFTLQELTDDAEIIRNPTGLFIKSFSISQETK